MASGSVGLVVTAHDSMWFNWWENSQSTENNSTEIGWNLTLTSDAYGRINSTAQKSYWVNVNGVYYEGINTVGIGANGNIILASGTTVISHETDGKKDFSFSFAQYFGITFSDVWIGSINGSGTGTLTPIARASQPSCITYPNTTQNVGDLGSTITVHMNRKSTEFIHYVYAVWGDRTVEVGANVTDNIEWKLPLDFASGVPNGTTGYGTIVADTYIGSTYIGTKHVDFIATIPSSIIPTVTIATSDPTGYKTKYGAFVQGQSKFKTEVTASGVYGSTIKSYKIEADGKTYTSIPVTTDVISGKGELTIKATVTDSRDRASAISGKVNVLPYTTPQINSISVYRCNENGEKANSGEYLAVKFSAKITALNNKNSAVYSIQYKKSSDTEYTTEEVITDYSGQYTIQNGVFIFAADTASSYDIIFTASDDFLSVDKTATGSSIKKLWSILKRGFGFAFGKIAELANTLEIALDTVFYNTADFREGIKIKGKDLDYIVEQGETEDGWYYRKWNNGTAECYQNKVFTFHATLAWGSGYISCTNDSSATSMLEQTLPEGLFAEVYDAQITLYKPGYLLVAMGNWFDSTSVKCYVWLPTGPYDSLEVWNSCRVIGRWK